MTAPRTSHPPAEPRAGPAPRLLRPGGTQAQPLGPVRGLDDGDRPPRSNQAGGLIACRFHARDLNLVMGPAAPGTPIPFRVLLDGQPPGTARGIDVDGQGNGTASQQRLYQLIRQPGPITDHTFEIAFPDPGVQAYSFTFG